MKKLYIEPSVRIYRLKVESNILSGTTIDPKIPPSSGIDKFIDETPVDEKTKPGTIGGDYGDGRPGFIEGN